MAITKQELARRIAVLKIEHAISKGEWLAETLTTQVILDKIKEYEQQLKSHSDIR